MDDLNLVAATTESTRRKNPVFLCCCSCSGRNYGGGALGGSINVRIEDWQHKAYTTVWFIITYPPQLHTQAPGAVKTNGSDKLSVHIDMGSVRYQSSLLDMDSGR